MIKEFGYILLSLKIDSNVLDILFMDCHDNDSVKTLYQYLRETILKFNDDICIIKYTVF